VLLRRGTTTRRCAHDALASRRGVETGAVRRALRSRPAGGAAPGRRRVCERFSLGGVFSRGANAGRSSL